MAGDPKPPYNWWASPKGAGIGESVIAAVNQVQETSLGIQTRFLRNMERFGGYGYMAAGRFSTNTAGSGQLSRGSARAGPRDNIVYSVVSTVCSQLLDDGAPGVSFLTSHGDYALQERAKLLEQFTDGLFYQVGFDAESTRVLFDACITGTGFMKYFVDADNTLQCERTFPAEIMVDIWDGRDQKPRSLYQVGMIDRDVLASRYPKKKKEIMEVKPSLPVGFTTVAPGSSNVVPYLEAWHLPSSSEASDGRHVLALPTGLAVLDEEYEDRDFPFSVLRFESLPTGFHGMGISELLQGHQSSLNDANRAEFWAWSQVAAPRLFMASGTLDKNHLNSSLSGIILEGTGPAPQVLNWSGTHPAFVEWKNDVKASAFALIGVAQSAASSMKPPGLNSGEAQRVYADQQHSRFSILSQRWQEFRVDAARKMISLARRVYTSEGAFKVKVIGKNFIKEIDFKDADLAEDEYRMKPMPINQLSKSVSGRIQSATEMLQANLIDQDTGRKLLQLPDLDEAMDVQNAAYDNAKRTAYLMLHEGKAQQPDPIQNLQLCIKTVTAEALKAIDNDAPKERIDLCRKWLVQAKALLQPDPAPGAAPGAPGPGGAPPPGAGPIAAGAAPPVSSILPFKKPPP